MTYRTLAACAAALSFAVAGQALAAGSVSVKLAQPVAEPVKFVAGGAMFNCEGDSCVATSATSKTFASATCKDIAKKVGQVAAFEDTRKAFDAERLSACNAAAGADTQFATR